MRLDKYLVVEYQITRSVAQDYINEGIVAVNGKVILKASYDVNVSDQVFVSKRTHDYVSRSAVKLLDALQTFQIDLTDQVVLDVGASTGGFSEVCLEANAQYVYALDVGHNQLASRLHNHPRLKSMEGINAKDMQPAMFDKPIHFVCSDVSFISLQAIFPAILRVSQSPLTCILLIKPQFEAGKEHLSKSGIVRDKKVHIAVLNRLIQYFKECKINVCGLKQAAIPGRSGNQEYVIYLSSEKPSIHLDIKAIVA